MPPEADARKDFTIPEAIALAVQAQRAGKIDAAAEIYRSVLAAWPECPDALHFSGLLKFQRGEIAEGTELVARSLEFAPEHPDFWNNYGNILRAAEKLPAAANAYRRALALHADFADAHNNLGTIHERDGDSAASEKEFRSALAINPDHAEAHLNLGGIFEKRDQLDEACAAYEKVIALRPNDPTAYGCLGEILWRQGRRDEATAAIIRDTQMNPGDPYAFVILGGIFWDQDRRDEALEAYRRALEINPRHHNANHVLALALNLLGRRADAAEVWRRWLALEPENPIPRHQLAACEGGDVPARAADDFVVQVFDGFAEKFDEKLRRLGYRAPEIVTAALAAEVGAPRAELDLLDAGCGTGLCAPLLRPFARTLEGADLSPGMLEKACARGGYDALHAAELTAFLAALREKYDAIVSADTLCYFGDLDAILRGAAGALRHGGALVFTVEKSADENAGAGFLLEPAGRYTHSAGYLRDALARAGFELRAMDDAVLRQEFFKPVHGFVVVARKVRG